MRMYGVVCFGLALATLVAAPSQAGDGIKTLSAAYGTPSEQRTCDAKAAVAQACDGKKSCDVPAGNLLCGDPDFGTRKTLDIQYQCGLAVAKSVTAAEQTEARLSCD